MHRKLSKYADYQHAFRYVGDGMIVQAEPGGTVEVQLTGHQLEMWSTGIISYTTAQRTAIIAASRGQAERHVGYSFADYLTVAAGRLRIPAPGLRDYVADSGHQQCAQQVDWEDQQGGSQLFDDGRWNGVVDPADLAELLFDRQKSAR